MNKKRIGLPLASSTWGDEEVSSILRVVQSNRYTMGAETLAFEEEFAALIGSRYAVMFNSGSSANLALIAASVYKNPPLIPRDSTVIVPAVSWSTTFYPVNQLGLKLSFVDIDALTLNIDTSKIEERITSSTSAIFAVNLLGNPADWIALQQLSEKYGLVLLEDNCESLGASLNNQQTGTFGQGGTFSTFFSHHISTMEGGLVATNDSALNDALRSIRAHGWTRDLQEENSVFPKTGNDWEDLFRFVLPGYNLRPLEMEAAIGREQIRKLPNFVNQRRRNADLIVKQKNSFPNIQMQVENGNSSWFGFSFVLNGNLTGRRRELIQELDAAGIESRPIVGGNFTKNPVMKHLDYETLPDLFVADHIHANGFFVGNHHYDLTLELEHLVEILTNFERKYT